MTKFKSGYVAQLDGIRGLAIIVVLFYHFNLFAPVPISSIGKVVSEICKFGWVGVDLFFVLSGYLITGILVKSKNESGYFKNFYARRTLRIFPLFYANLIVFFIIAPMLFSQLPIQIAAIKEYQIWFWTYTANWLFAFLGDFNQAPGGYFWSLAVEEQFYLMWPLLIYLVPNKKLVKTCFWLFFACIFIRVLLMWLGGTTTAAYTITFTHMDGLILGSLLTISLYEGLDIEKIKNKLLLLTCLSVIGCISIYIYTGHFHFYDYPVALIGYSLLSIIFLGLIVFTIYENNLLNKIFSKKFLIWFGKYSYALYLIHVPFANIIAIYIFDPCLDRGYSPLLSKIIFFFLSLVGSIFLSYLSWNLFEKHFLKLKRYFV